MKYSHLLLPGKIFSIEALCFFQNRFQETKKILNSNAVYIFSLFIIIFIICIQVPIYITLRFSRIVLEPLDLDLIQLQTIE